MLATAIEHQWASGTRRRGQRVRERRAVRRWWGWVTCRDPITWQNPLTHTQLPSETKPYFLSSAKTWFWHTISLLSVIITTALVYFQPRFYPTPSNLHQSIYWSGIDFQYMTAASIDLTKWPFCRNNSPYRYSIKPLHIACLHLCVMTNQSSAPATRLIHYSKPSA